MNCFIALFEAVFFRCRKDNFCLNWAGLRWCSFRWDLVKLRWALWVWEPWSRWTKCLIFLCTLKQCDIICKLFFTSWVFDGATCWKKATVVHHEIIERVFIFIEFISILRLFYWLEIDRLKKLRQSLSLQKAIIPTFVNRFFVLERRNKQDLAIRCFGWIPRRRT